MRKKVFLDGRFIGYYGGNVMTQDQINAWQEVVEKIWQEAVEQLLGCDIIVQPAQDKLDTARALVAWADNA